MPQLDKPTALTMGFTTWQYEDDGPGGLRWRPNLTFVDVALCFIAFVCTLLLLDSTSRQGQSHRRRTPGGGSSKYNIDRSRQQRREEVNTRCTLTREHIEMMATRKWKSVVSWIASHPEELRYLDKKSHTALHLAILFRAPAHVVELVLDRAPELAGQRNDEGEIALHWAVRLLAPKELLGLLLKADPSSGFLAVDDSRNTPFSLLWDRHREILQSAWLEGRDELLSQPAWTHVMNFFQAYHHAITTNEPKSSTNAADDSIDSPASSIVVYLLNVRPLHLAASVVCPSEFFSLMVRVFRDQLGETDDAGRLPLSIACSDPVANCSSSDRTKIQILLSEDPTAARLRDGAEGRLPLFTALASGVTWEQGISLLLPETASKATASMRDPVTGLYAFMLAAAAGARHFNGRDGEDGKDCADSDGDEIQCLSTVYRVLRADPVPLVRIASAAEKISP